MDERCRALLDAHVAFELRQWQGKALDKQVAAEVQHLWDWLAATPLEALIDAATIGNVVRESVLTREPGPGLAAGIGATIRRVLDDPLHADTRVADVLDQSVFEVGVALAADMEDARHALIRGVTRSPVYAAVASEVLYHGIRDYLFSDRALLRRIPGVSSLLSAGAGAVSKRLPQLEVQVEKQVRAYLEANLSRTLAQSETFLAEALTADRIRALGDQIWEALADRPLLAARVLTDDDVDALADFGVVVWNQLRDTEYVDELVARVIDAIYAEHGSRPVTDLLADVGVDAPGLARDAQRLIKPLAARARADGSLEALLRRRLEPFYASSAAAKVLGGA
ncbi:MAG: hypothetical protein RJQ08_08000 [Salinisphaeraceae bacterium]